MNYWASWRHFLIEMKNSVSFYSFVYNSYFFINNLFSLLFSFLFVILFYIQFHLEEIVSIYVLLHYFSSKFFIIFIIRIILILQIRNMIKVDKKIAMIISLSIRA